MEKIGEVWVEEYQPVDEQGNAVGPLKKFEGRTKEEVYDKVLASNKNASVKLHELRLANKLGTLLEPDPEEPIVEFKEVLLTADDRVRITKMLSDPAQAAEGQRLLLEAQLGAPLTVIRQKLQEVEITKRQENARIQGAKFLKDNPDYVDCDANNDLMMKYLQKRKLAYTAKNLGIAFSDLKNGNYLVIQPPKADKIVTPVAQPAIPIVPTPAPGDSGQQPNADTQVPSGGQQPLQPKQSSSGLRRENSSAAPGLEAPKTAGITIRDINKMTAKEYQEALRDPEFRKQVDALYAKK